MMKNSRKERDLEFVGQLIRDYNNMNSPSVRRLAETYGMNYTTVYNILKDAGIRMPKGKGKVSDTNQGFDSFVLNIKKEIEQGIITEGEASARYSAYVRVLESNSDSVYYGKESPFSSLGLNNDEQVSHFQYHNSSELDTNGKSWPDHNLLKRQF